MKKRVVHHLVSAVLGIASCSMVGTAFAVIPPTIESDPEWNNYYEKGYLVATAYLGTTAAQARAYVPSETNAGNTTSKLQEAINDARNNNLVLYLPAKTYYVNDTLRAYTSTTNKIISDIDPVKDTYPIAIVGETGASGGARATIKVANVSFGDSTKEKIVLDYKNFETKNDIGNLQMEQPAGGYHQMLRNVTIDCSLKVGCVGLYFNQAQDSTIENVKVIATDSAHAGIQGLPARAAGAVNIEVVGGKFGIDTFLLLPNRNCTFGVGCRSLSNIGSTIVGVKLRGQTESAIRHTGQTLTVVGFDIDTGANNVPAIRTYRRNEIAAVGNLVLIDGTITVNGVNPAVRNWGDNVPDNGDTSGVMGGKASFVHLKNVYVENSTSDNHVLYQSRDNKEFSCDKTCRGGKVISHVKELAVEHDGTTVKKSTAAPPLGNVLNNIDGLGTNNHVVKGGVALLDVPSDLISRHVWKSLPSVDDNDYVVFPTLSSVNEPSYNNKVYDVSVADFNKAILDNRKIFLRKGIYRLTSTSGNPVKLQSNSIVFGAARHLTRIEVKTDVNTGVPEFAFKAGCVGLDKSGCNTPVITTVADTEATTYLGDLSIGVPAKNRNYDYFTALDWDAGRNSMVHVGRFYHSPTGGELTNPHDLVTIGATGGGRWYFFSRGQSRGMTDPLYRILRVTGSSQPLWFYGLNMEHADGRAFAQFTDAKNIRIYGVKTEFEDKDEDASGKLYDNDLLQFSTVDNVAVYGHANFDQEPAAGFSIINFANQSSTNFSVALAVPDVSSTGGNVLFTAGTTTPDIQFPNGVGLYKKGIPDDALMKHAGIGYANTITTVIKSPGSAAAQTWAGDTDGFEIAPLNGVIAAVAGTADGVVQDSDSGQNVTHASGCGNTQHDAHQFSDFPFTIPLDKKIKGIKVKVRAKVSEAGTSDSKLCIRLNNGSTTWTDYTVDREKILTDAYVDLAIGGSGDLWGMPADYFTPVVMNGPDFKVRVTNVSSSNTQDFFLDLINVEVTYQ